MEFESIPHPPTLFRGFHMSDWKERSLKRRDARQTKVPDIRPPSGSKKNTKKWCRGVKGREHELLCVAHNTFKDWRVLTCTKCGKQVDIYFNCSWFIRPRPKPDWVTF